MWRGLKRAPRQPPRLVFAYRYGIAGGVSTQLVNRFQAFSDAFDVHVLFTEDLGMVASFPQGRAQATPTPAARVQALRRLRPDILAVVDDPDYVQAWREAGRPGRCVLEVHSTYTSGLAYLDHPETLAGVDRIICVSDYLHDMLVRRGVDCIAPIHVVPNCLDERWTAPATAAPTPGPRVVWVGKVDGHKRWRSAAEIMARATRAARAIGLDARPLLVGGHSTNGTELRALTVRLADSPELALASWWPRVDYDLMPQMYSAVGAGGGVLVSASADESFGMAVAEALVRGCPVVAPRVGALPALLPEEALYDPRDLADGAARATRAMLDRDVRARMLGTAEEVRALTDPATALAAYRRALG